MTTFDDIRQSISPELAELNRVMREALGSDCELLNTVVESYLQSKGKQIRPIIVLLSAKFLSKVTPEVIDAAASIELLHNASLIHDDVIDNTLTRRGKATINSVWDNHVAVLAGDFFVSNALQCAIKTKDLRVIYAISELGKVLAMGELDQIDIAKKHAITKDSYLSIISRKTASLFRCCVEVSGYTLKASNEDIENLAQYVEQLGLCFQIKDDIFDYFKDDAVGKPTGNDLREGKVTLPLIYALSKGTDKASEMKQLLSKDFLSDEEIETLIEFAKEEGGIEYAYAEMERIEKSAKEILAPYPDSEAKDAFLSLFSFIIKRHK